MFTRDSARYSTTFSQIQKRCLPYLAMLGMCLGSVAAAEQPANSPEPQLNSIRAITISAADPETSASRYEQHLGYERVETGSISDDIARGWQLPALSGRDYVVIRSKDDDDAYIRFVQSESSDAYTPGTRLGWSALELLTRDPYALHQKLTDSPFMHLSGPTPLAPGSAIHAMQYLGPDNEIIYFTADLGQKRSTLPRTQQDVGRAFIVVLAAASLDDSSEFYVNNYAMSEAFRTRLPISFLADAQQLDTWRYPLLLMRLAAFGHSLEIDEYPKSAQRRHLPDKLPAGIGVVTFCADAAVIKGVENRYEGAGIVYSNKRMSAMSEGPSGERIELVNC